MENLTKDIANTVGNLFWLSFRVLYPMLATVFLFMSFFIFFYFVDEKTYNQINLLYSKINTVYLVAALFIANQVVETLAYYFIMIDLGFGKKSDAYFQKSNKFVAFWKITQARVEKYITDNVHNKNNIDNKDNKIGIISLESFASEYYSEKSPYIRNLRWYLLSREYLGHNSVVVITIIFLIFPTMYSYMMNYSWLTKSLVVLLQFSIVILTYFTFKEHVQINHWSQDDKNIISEPRWLFFARLASAFLGIWLVFMPSLFLKLTGVGCIYFVVILSLLKRTLREYNAVTSVILNFFISNKWRSLLFEPEPSIHTIEPSHSD